MALGGNYSTLFTPGIWKVLHAVLQPKAAGGPDETRPTTLHKRMSA
jgi:hypothetical protein